ncbi:MAG: site-specific integrase [Actinomycetota bacterium]|nr:site-specific integrase [Actinomycetota bacterium]
MAHRTAVVKGSMREKRPGYWELRVFAGVDPLTGQKQYRTRTFRGTKRQASSALAVLVTEVDGGVVEPKKCTVAELLDAWLDHIEHVGRSPSTLYGYRRLVRQLPEGFLGLPLGKVTPKVLDDLYRLLSKQTTRKPATVLRFHSVLRAAFAQAVRWGWLDRNPVERATPPRVEQVETVPPVVADVLRVLDAAAASRNPENAVVFRLVAATGCRRGEVCGLKWSAVDIDGDMPRVMIRRGVLDIQRQRIVRDTKNHGVRWVGLDRETAELLRRYRERSYELGKVAEAPVTADDFVFPRSPGSDEPLPPNRIGQAWRRLCRQLGVEARLHDLRHLQASLLLDAGEAITTVSARLGHRDTSTTLKIYSHLMPGADQRAAGIVGKAFTRPPSEDSPDASQ